MLLGVLVVEHEQALTAFTAFTAFTALTAFTAETRRTQGAQSLKKKIFNLCDPLRSLRLCG